MVAQGNFRGLFELARRHQRDLGCRVVVMMGEPEKALRTLEKRNTRDIVGKVIALLGEGSSLVVPFAGLVAAAATTGLDLLSDREPRTPDDVVRLMRDLIQRLSSEGPCLLLFGSGDDSSNETLWYTTRYLLSNYTLPNIGIALGVSQVTNKLEVGWRLQRELDELIEARAAYSLVVPSLDHSRARRWLTEASDDVIDLVCVAAGGDDLDAAAVWADWVRDDRVRRERGGAWQFTSQLGPIEDIIHDALIARVPKEDWTLVRSALSHASVSGSAFSVSAVREVTAARTGISAEHVEDSLDLLLPDAGSGPALLSIGHYYTHPRTHDTHWVYRFSSHIVARYLARDLLRDVELCGELYAAALRCHGAGPAFVQIAERLAVGAGRPHDARRLAARTALAHRQRELVALSAVLSALASEPGAPLFVVDDLLGVVRDLATAGAFGRALPAARTAETITLLRTTADTTGSPSLRRQHAEALWILGAVMKDLDIDPPAFEKLGAAVSEWRVLWEHEGEAADAEGLASALQTLAIPRAQRRDFDGCVAAAEEAVLLRRLLTERDYTPYNRRKLASALTEDAVCRLLRSQYREPGSTETSTDQQMDVASRHLDQSIDLYRDLAVQNAAEVGDELAETLRFKAVLAVRGGDRHAAVTLLREAVDAAVKTADDDPTSQNLSDVAVVRGELAAQLLHLGESHLPEAVAVATEAVEAGRTLCETVPTWIMRSMLARDLHTLADALERTGSATPVEVELIRSEAASIDPGQRV